MAKPIRRLQIAVTLLGAAALCGCAAETDGWPRMGDFSRITQKVLTPQEQDQAIRSMTAEQKAEQAKAIEKIENKK